MKKVCIIGNSHTACIKMALDGESSDLIKDHAVTVFGSYSKMLKNAQVENGMIIPVSKKQREIFSWTSGGQEEIEIGSYDAFFVVAGRSLFSIEPFLTADGLPPLSDSAIEKILSQVFRDNWSLDFARRVADQSSPATVYHVGHPFLADVAPLAQSVAAQVADGHDRVMSRVQKVQAAINHMVQVSSTETLSFCRPPAAALDELGLFTRHEFSRGSRRLLPEFDQSHAADDFFHMNEKYGDLSLTDFLSHV
ncbi:hypothetical protein [Palleronia caenipelagi]|uniref:Uncharacterized protein n=1 Tax=Palleronia caenipelagi TaxID=2489174 RepID=A0A547PKI5_9RHOB|nr:hypothetical protein [Palleronia caenipelagi]TRD14668.1 hypothetical protein FEV53_18515 [Palleronia caenipelagi]